MTYYLVVFSSRSETMKFSNLLSSYGFTVAFVNTPRQISVACGISAKIDKGSLFAAREILNRRQFYTFSGIYYSYNNEYIKI